MEYAADAKFIGEEADASGLWGSVAPAGMAGDVNGDGFADILLGFHGASDFDGAAYVVYGPVTGSVDLSLADARLLGDRQEFAGYSVALAGDVNADGLDDILVGGPNYGVGSTSWPDTVEGQAYLILGPPAREIRLESADALFHGDVSVSGGAWETGSSVTGVGDIDGDGYDDVAVSARSYGLVELHTWSVGRKKASSTFEVPRWRSTENQESSWA